MTPSETTPTGSAPRRSDGVRNRERLLHEAEVLFGEVGVTAPLDELARRAEVSSATLYRHFPSREEIIRALVERLGARLDDTFANKVLTAPTAGERVEQLVLETASILIHYPASRPVIIAMQQLDPEWVPGARFQAPVEQMVAEAKDEGVLRHDVLAQDITMAALMIGSFGAFRLMRETGMWRRYAAFVLDGLRPSAAQNPTSIPNAPDEEYYRSMLGPGGSQAEHG